MKITLYFLFALVLMSCSKNMQIDNEMASGIEKDSIELLELYPSENFGVDITGSVVINDLNPEKVYVTDKGIYIVLNSSLATESGIYVPRSEVQVDTSNGNDPSYEYVSGRVYKYKIKG